MKLEDLQALESALDKHASATGEVQMTRLERESLANQYGVSPLEIDGFANTLAQAKGLQVLKSAVRAQLGLGK
ncbi:hypothetical protein [Thiothrix fructosivorans]|uniref:Uncharacterized protein n=1 Tax=Thiothrix fructosivorans TaxID=111770 RepID=A0A8B0SKL7_9GAMM|nr:hypothetical protein [Thiothrix fructosivorans]MBO0612976.1 hypothetical protein [Thiothrix fructosivorans]QTX11575.1 hypothetical protein J1836_004270 [Thiothrix fructosivorans]